MKYSLPIFLVGIPLGLALLIVVVSHDAHKSNLPPDTICHNYKVVSYYQKVDDMMHWVGPETHVLCIISTKELEEVSQ